MALPIFYFAQLDDDFVTLDEETSRHIIQVLRMEAGEQTQLTDGRGKLYTAEIADAHKKKCVVKVVGKKFQLQKEKRVSIAISLLKNAYRFEWFLEKATEIGVSDIIPFISHRTEKTKFRSDRMHQILVAAMIQSQQVWLPVLHHPASIEEVITSSQYAVKLVAHCEEDNKQHIRDHYHSSSVQILIGPEGDFTKQEIEAALHNGYLPVTLGETRLRAETAGVVAATLLSI